MINNLKKWSGFLLLSGVVIAALFYCLSNTQAEPEVVSLQEEPEIASSTQHVNLKKYFTEQIGKKIEEQEAHYHQAKEEIARQNKQAQNEVELLKKDNDDLHESFLKLRMEFEQTQQRESQSVMSPTRESQPDFYSGMMEQTLERLPLVDEFEVVSVELESEDAACPHASSYVTAGTHIKAVLLGGIDAHTEVYGNNETRVVTLRLIEDGVMPNGFSAPLKNCVLLASAWGNASSERVVMRGERLSCIHEDGKVFEQDLLGIVYGPDGREDVKGQIFYPEGKLVQRAFIAGSLSGLGSGIGEGFIKPLGTAGMINPGEMLSYGAAQGSQKGLDKLADYYIKRAEKLQPIVRVPAGVLVDVVIQKGFSMKGDKKKNEPQSKSKKMEHDSIDEVHQEALAVLGKFSEGYDEE